MSLQKTTKKFGFKKTIIILLGCAVVAGGAYYAYHHVKPTVLQQAPVVSVDVQKVVLESVYPKSSFVAKIEAQDKVGLRARVQGFLQERLFKEGDIVKKGQPLFVIEPVNFEATVREAEANVAKAQAQVKNAKAQYERTQILFKTKDVSESKLDTDEAAYSSAQASLGQAQAKLDLAKKDLEYTTIVAPMDGKIGESVYSVGELIGPSSGVLAEVVAVNPIDAVFSVSENEMLSLQKNFKTGAGVVVRFVTSDGVLYPEAGEINFVDVTLDEAMNTLKIKASFPNPNNKLISGQYGRVTLQGNEAVQEIVIPMKAVQQDMLGSYVYVVNGENRIEKKDVTRGTELDGFQVVITSGLKAGDIIVVEGFQKIAPQALVNPVFVGVGE